MSAPAAVLHPYEQERERERDAGGGPAKEGGGKVQHKKAPRKEQRKERRIKKFGLAIDDGGDCLTGGVKADSMRRRPAWAWQVQGTPYPPLVKQCGTPVDPRNGQPFLPADEMQQLLWNMEKVRHDVRKHLEATGTIDADSDMWQGAHA